MPLVGGARHDAFHDLSGPYPGGAAPLDDGVRGDPRRQIKSGFRQVQQNEIREGDVAVLAVRLAESERRDAVWQAQPIVAATPSAPLKTLDLWQQEVGA